MNKGGNSSWLPLQGCCKEPEWGAGTENIPVRATEARPNSASESQ